MPRRRSYARLEPSREPYDLVLIVCEGGKSEPNYLNGLRAEYRLSSTNIRITPADGTDPLSVVNFAEEVNKRYDHDRVYCVFDRDQHTTFDAAMRKISQLQNFFAVPSWPCFEIWIMLHFIYSASPCDAASALREVKRHIPQYAKGHQAIFDLLKPSMMTAIQNAKRLELDNRATGSTNPATAVHALVEYLVALKGSG